MPTMKKTTQDTPETQEPSLVDASRRRLTKAGLAAPAVMGLLASRQVLGAAPYQCTLSGFISGNTSPNGPATTASCRTGNTRSDWLSATSWTPYDKGTTGVSNSNSCSFNGGHPAGSYFNTVTGTAAFFYNPNAACAVTTNNTAPNTAATMLQVLNTDPLSQTSEQFVLGRVTVVSLLNSYNVPDYPVNAATIIDMFSHTFFGGTYLALGTVPWSRSNVIAYLTSLLTDLTGPY
jgi:hypothetical protein